MSDRVILARRTSGFVPYQWTGHEPEGLDDEEVALANGARWEDEELVTYDLAGLELAVASDADDYLNDND